MSIDDWKRLKNEMAGNRGEVKHFYDNAVVFITGGTGFLGKLILEKLLRYTMLAKIYVLVRYKKGKSESLRLQETFEDQIFNFLKEERPDFMSRVELIMGDCKHPNLGIKELDWKLLKANVNVLFHYAATVRFDQDLKTAAHINIRATMDIIKHAKEMTKLKAFVHVSTAFTNCPRKEIGEEFYPPPMAPKNLLELVDLMTDTQLEACTPGIIKEWPNTYTFTKFLAEDVIKTDASGLPIAVIRPAIVMPTYKEPLAGWVSNYYGMIGFTCATYLGLLRTIHAIPEYTTELVPADYVTNMIVATAWKVSGRKIEENRNIDIYNYVSTPEAPINWAMLEVLTFKWGLRNPTLQMMWRPILYVDRYFWRHKIVMFLTHTVPGYLVDFLCVCIGKKPEMRAIYEKIKKLLEIIQYFATREWMLTNKNTQELWKSLNNEDKNIFPFSMAQLDWDEYCRTYLLGARIYLLKDPIETIPAARRKLLLFNSIYYPFVSVILGCLLWFLYTCWNWLF